MVRIKLDDFYKEFNKVYLVRVIIIIIIERMLVFKGIYYWIRIKLCFRNY